MKTPLLVRAVRDVAPLIFPVLALLGGHAQAAVTGNAKAAEKKVAMCIGCHGIPGYQSSFPEVHKVPMISGQSAGYIQAALLAYQKGDRRHPTMKGIAASLTEQDIADLAAYYEVSGQDQPARSSPKRRPDPRVDDLLAKGNCVACHGEGLNKPIDPSYPKLAGQHADYLLVALKSYQLGKSDKIGRTNPIMASQVQMFTNEELKLLARHMESLPGDLKVVTQPRFK